MNNDAINACKMYITHFVVQDGTEASRVELAKQERERLRKQDLMKRQRLEEVRQQQNNLAEASEVCGACSPR
jgi:hypothetical protein